ncbi:MAG: hypothetical protein HYR72_21790 [Deltaproteobacteria bacterium]|nr:hypothetical protein [Deltaproteobacteria bacterium]MBI3390151.1 hypothetical protein [Deltaproteobacteria bacterium]
MTPNAASHKANDGSDVTSNVIDLGTRRGTHRAQSNTSPKGISVELSIDALAEYALNVLQDTTRAIADQRRLSRGDRGRVSFRIEEIRGLLARRLSASIFAASDTYEAEFRRLADDWHRETDHFSNILRKVMSPAYQEIIGMGEKVIPLILCDLETTGGHWFWALKAIARQDAAAGIDNYDDAVRAWLSWGARYHGYRRRV